VTARAQSAEDNGPAVRAAFVTIADVTLIADLSGAFVWESERLLVVSDLHLEKGSSFAARGVLLPPYDTVATLSRLSAVIARHDPRSRRGIAGAPRLDLDRGQSRSGAAARHRRRGRERSCVKRNRVSP
jgi:hypothetical protein